MYDKVCADERERFVCIYSYIPLDIVLCQIGMYGCYVDTVIVLRLLLDLINDGLCLRHVTRPSDYLDISAANHHAVHLFQCQLCRLRYLVFHERESLVFLCDRVPGHVDGFDWSKW